MHSWGRGPPGQERGGRGSWSSERIHLAGREAVDSLQGTAVWTLKRTWFSPILVFLFRAFKPKLKILWKTMELEGLHDGGSGESAEGQEKLWSSLGSTEWPAHDPCSVLHAQHIPLGHDKGLKASGAPGTGHKARPWESL